MNFNSIKQQTWWGTLIVFCVAGVTGIGAETYWPWGLSVGDLNAESRSSGRPGNHRP